MKLFDSELKVMKVLWERGETPAQEIARTLGEETGWNKNTTYTIIRRCIAKGAVERIEPGFLCRALITQEQVRREEAAAFVDKYCGGSLPALFSALTHGRKPSAGELDELQRMIDEARG